MICTANVPTVLANLSDLGPKIYKKICRDVFVGQHKVVPPQLWMGYNPINYRYNTYKP